MTALSLSYVRALQDNYIWLIQTREQVIIVDPGEAQPVINYLQKAKLKLAAIFITHHHYDHTNGIAEIVKQFSSPVYGPLENIEGITHLLKDNDIIKIAGFNNIWKIISTPGHTLGHISYYTNGFVLTGDTLFLGGCGRLFEGSAAQLYHSLVKLAQLPDSTLIYCAHEYTINNLKFALSVEPNNYYISHRLAECLSLQGANLPTVPALLFWEKLTNPFLRCHCSAVITSAQHYSGKLLSNPIDVFTILRLMKDSF